MKLTCNQMMLLLALYRGSPIDAVACGTKEDDLKKLRRMGYVNDQDQVTHNGDKRVSVALTGRA